MKFTLLKEDKQSKARLGEIETAHGKIKTPIFIENEDTINEKIICRVVL